MLDREQLIRVLLANERLGSFRPVDLPNIFDLSVWRDILIGTRGNQSLCAVPSEYLPIANGYCHAQGRYDCPTIPCTLIHLTHEWTQTVKCLRGGKRSSSDKFDWMCRKTPALEILSHSHWRPSIMAEAYTKLTAELFGRALSPYRDGQNSKWGLTLVGESVAYYPSVMHHRRFLPLFDITLGYDRRLFDLVTDVHLTDYVQRIVNKTSHRLSIPQVMHNKVQGQWRRAEAFFGENIDRLGRAPILWINRNCDALSNRTGYVLELMRHIRIDVRGKCGNPNWTETTNMSDINRWSEEKVTLASGYLFTIAIENSLEYDYVTEKLWQPLAAGSVPLYLGAPNIDEWLPCTNLSCIVHLRDFSSPRHAAQFILDLVRHRKDYLSYHKWRRDEKLPVRFMNMVNYFHQANQHSIDCLLCDMVHRNDHGALRRRLLAANDPFNDIFPSLL